MCRFCIRCLRTADGTLGVAVLDRHAVHEQPVQRAVAPHQVRPSCLIGRQVGTRKLAEGVLQYFGGKFGIEAHERVAQALDEDHVAVVGSRGASMSGAISGPCAICQASNKVSGLHA